MRYLGILLVIFLGMNACKAPKRAMVELPLGKYDVINLYGESIDDKARVDMNFDSQLKRVTGSTGCNKYSAPMIMEEGSLIIGNAMVTEMYCTFMPIESKFLKAMVEVASYQYEADEILLLDENKNVILKGKK
ncbi:META domain-containing protein [Mesonia sp. MT50]|uniref:META domain-containing protein n=1 Tax=Mesonia profundi TaxID=3070998 RepID=A0ABU1A0A3_9FLAO|nr:META domain-containing protein [Mesonia profundi]MDQ7916329.1 META domain-containing protein [Mesonia profundi]